MTKWPAEDQQAYRSLCQCLNNLAFSNHHDLPKIKSIDGYTKTVQAYNNV